MRIVSLPPMPRAATLRYIRYAIRRRKQRSRAKTCRLRYCARYGAPMRQTLPCFYIDTPSSLMPAARQIPLPIWIHARQRGLSRCRRRCRWLADTPSAMSRYAIRDWRRQRCRLSACLLMPMLLLALLPAMAALLQDDGVGKAPLPIACAALPLPDCLARCCYASIFVTYGIGDNAADTGAWFHWVILRHDLRLFLPYAT